jgi:hypothetical protein
MTISHRDARIMICEGYRRIYGAEPSRSVAQCVQAVGILETNYGQGWSPKVPGAVGSFNMGAITAGREWTGETFEHRDSYPDATGKNIWYSTKFRRYPSAQDGMTDLVRIVYAKRPSALAAAKAGDSYAFSAAMYDTTYYKGFGKTREERIANHHKAVTGAIARMCKALGEDAPTKIDAAAFNAAADEAEADDRSWAELRAEAMGAQVDVVGALHADAMADLAGMTTQPPEPNES